MSLGCNESTNSGAQRELCHSRGVPRGAVEGVLEHIREVAVDRIVVGRDLMPGSVPIGQRARITKNSYT